MKRIRTIIIGFGVFGAVAVLVLAYGLYRRARASGELRDLLASADRVLRTDLADFVAQPPAEQDRLVSQARDIQRQLQSHPKAPPSKAELLGEFLADRAAARAVLERKRRELTALERVLAQPFPDDSPLPKTQSTPRPTMQIAPAKAQELREAVRAVKKLEPRLTAEVAGNQVDLAPTFRREAEQLGGLADKATGELERREAAFAKFATETKEVVRKQDVAEARRRAADFDAWFLCVVDCPEKQRELAQLEGMISQGSRQPDQQKVVQARVAGLLAAMRNGKGREKQIALTQFAEVYEAAKAAGLPAEKLQELSQARDAIADAGRRKQEEIQKATRRLELVEKTLWQMQPLAKTTNEMRKKKAEPTPEQLAQWKAKSAEIGGQIAALDVDEALKAFLRAILKETDLTPPPTFPPPKTIKEHRGPNWGKLDGDLQKLRQIEQKHRNGKYQGNHEIADALKKYLSAADNFLGREKGRLEDLQKKAGAEPPTPKTDGEP